VPGTDVPSVTRADIESLVDWMLASGCKRGNLRWSDIDLKAVTLTVQQARVLVDYKVRIEEPKTHNGKRTLPLDDDSVAALIETYVHASDDHLVTVERSVARRTRRGTPRRARALRERRERQPRGLPRAHASSSTARRSRT
jgi:integrase